MYYYTLQDRKVKAILRYKFILIYFKKKLALFCTMLYNGFTRLDKKEIKK